MVPISQKDWSNIYVVRHILRPVDDHGSEKTGIVLGTVVRMIPGGAIQISEEGVGKAFTGSDWALLNRRNAVKPRGELLKHTMPM